MYVPDFDKTLFFHRKNDFTGSTRVLANIIETLSNGTIVYVITERNGNNGFLSVIPGVRIIGIWVPHIKGRPIPILSPIIWRIHSLILAMYWGWRFDVFYINTINPYYAAIVGRLYKKKIVYHIHEKIVERTLSVKILEWFFNHTTAHRIFVSNYTKSQYLDNPKCSWEINYNKLSNSFKQGISICPIDKRPRNNILMISSLSKNKGVYTFLEVAKLLPNLNFRLVLGTDCDSIKAFFYQPIPKNVKILPNQLDIHPFLHDADIMLNLSIPDLWVETFGMTILEAMSYGIPSIVPNVGGPTELVTDGYNGYCVDVTNITIVSCAIKKALDRDNYEQLAKHALNHYLDIFA